MNLPSHHRLKKSGAHRAFGAGLLAGAWLAAEAASAGSFIMGDAVSLSQLSHRYNFIAYTAKGKNLALRTKFNTFTFEGDTRKVEFNNILIWLNAPVARHWGSWTIRDMDVEKTILPLINPPRALKSEGWRLVVLDPGHGGQDPGASDLRRGLEEKRIALELAQRVRTILQKYKVDVRLTRGGDQTTDLGQRCLLAHRWGADLFVSIHLNAAANANSSGIETHILPPAGCPITASAFVSSRDRVAFPGNRHDGANMVLGYYLQRSLIKYTRLEDRGVRRSRFYVIRNVDCPAALVECGFISSRNDRTKIMTSAYRDNVVRGIAEGIQTYLNMVKRAQALNP
ncbi:MAG: N-acetylmuramoyl-L-alanine amidase [Verrucomicrobia bacterium]|nr:N-acetylmuramoyl-L-alanine amidase [Verrucomicrobiota bacterium]MBU4285952.1 N-acetylmuramoyl-L-alanine amidase [Verrucomicrobiota bacterium]